jgi:hypothetical protein
MLVARRCGRLFGVEQGFHLVGASCWGCGTAGHRVGQLDDAEGAQLTCSSSAKAAASFGNV